MDTINKLKKAINNKNNLVLIIVLLVILLIAINYIFNEKEKIESKDVVSENTSTKDNEIESKLEKIIGSIEGVESANVMVAFSTTDKIIPVYDTKENAEWEKLRNQPGLKKDLDK